MKSFGSSLMLRLLAALCAVAAISTALALVFQDRSLNADLVRAANERLEKSAATVEWLAAKHVESRTARYEAFCSSPQVRALLELQHAPTVEDFAARFLSRENASRIVLTDQRGELLAGAGNDALDVRLLAADGSDLFAQEGRAYARIDVELHSGGREIGRLVAAEPIGADTFSEWSTLSGARVELVEPSAARDAAHLVLPVRDLGGLELRVAASLEREHAAVARSRSRLLVAGTLGLAVAFVAALFLAKGLLRPIVELIGAAERVGRGDLRVHIETNRSDEIGDLGRAFEHMAENLRATLVDVSRAADGMEQTAGKISTIAERVDSVTAAQTKAVGVAGSRIELLASQTREIAASAAASASTLDGAVDGHSVSFRQLAVSGDELGKQASALSEGVDEVAATIESVAASSRRMAEHTEGVATAACETSARMGAMAEATRSVMSNADEGAQLSESVVEAAEQGRATLAEAGRGMEEIDRASTTAQATIAGLAARIAEIGEIVALIDGVAQETNLLALNASIIAVRSNDHGRAFGVVADEMKTVAERVFARTREIGELIQAVQDESAAAIGAVSSTVASVSSGVALVAKGSSSLDEIAEAARQSGLRMSGILAAVNAQGRESENVVELMVGVSRGVEEIRAAGREQVASHATALELSRAMSESADRVRAVTDDHVRSAARIGDDIELVRRSVREMNQTLQARSSGFQDSVRSLEEVMSETGSNERSVEQMAEAMRALQDQAHRLRQALRRFVDPAADSR